MVVLLKDSNKNITYNLADCSLNGPGVRPVSLEQFSVGNHSEVRAIAKCIHQEIIRDSNAVNKNNINLDILATGTGDALAKQVEAFFSNNPACSVVGYSDRQPCKAPSFAVNNLYQGCENFLQRILPEDQHKIDYSFEYRGTVSRSKDNREFTKYEYNNQAIQAIFQQELLATRPKPAAKPRTTYFTLKPATLPTEPATLSPVADQASLPTDTMARSSLAAMGIHLSDLGDAALWLPAEPEQKSATESQQSDQSSQALWEAPSGIPSFIPEGLKFVGIPGDGNCLYNAVAIYLSQDVQTLRQIVATNLEHNISEYRQFIVLAEGRTIEDYIRDIRDTNEWAGDLEITILSRLLDRAIITIGPNGNITNREVLGEQRNGEPIFVYYNNVNHYDGLVFQEGFNVRKILETLLQEGTQNEMRVYVRESPFAYQTQTSHHEENIKHPMPIPIDNNDADATSSQEKSLSRDNDEATPVIDSTKKRSRSNSQ